MAVSQGPPRATPGASSHACARLDSPVLHGTPALLNNSGPINRLRIPPPAAPPLLPQMDTSAAPPRPRATSALARRASPRLDASCSRHACCTGWRRSTSRKADSFDVYSGQHQTGHGAPRDPMPNSMGAIACICPLGHASIAPGAGQTCAPNCNASTRPRGWHGW